MKFKFSRDIFEKVLNIRFNQNPSIGSRVIPCGQRDGHDEANSRFSQFCKRAKKRSNQQSGFGLDGR
jgi:hypothetical protein